MVRSTLRCVIVALSLAPVQACTKDNPPYSKAGENTPLQELQTTLPNTSLSSDPLALPSADAKNPSNDAAAALECPNTNEWTKLESFAPACSYAWTTTEQKLPAALEWEPCSPNDGAPRAECKKLKRYRPMKSFTLGTNDAGDTHIGFVEHCSSDQIVLANIDGPIRFAMRRADNERFSSMCQMKLLAVDMGHWLAALGGHEAPSDSKISGYSAGGAFIGGTIGSAPEVLLSRQTDPFHVATSQGTILPEGWTADGKRQYWNGKNIETPPQLNLQRVTKRLFINEKKGFYIKTKADSELLLPFAKGRSLAGFARRDKRIVWQEQTGEPGRGTCSLSAGEIDEHERLVKPRRIAEVPCTSSRFVTGCNAVFISDDTRLYIVSLADGTTRTMRMKGIATALTCKEAFIEHKATLMRIDLASFGRAKPPPEPPIELPMQSRPN